jgi:replicative DNA helicase
MADNLQLNAEVALVALLLNHPELYTELDHIKPTDLKQGQNSQRIYEVGLELAKTGELTKPAVMELVGNEKLVEKYWGFDHDVSRLENYISIVLAGEDLARYNLRQQLADYQREIEKNKLIPIDQRVFRPSLVDLTRKIGGLYRGEMSVNGGRPGTGKTAINLQNAREFGQAKQKSVYFAFELSGFRFIDRMIASESDSLLFEEIIELSYVNNEMKERDFLRTFANLHKEEMYLVTGDRTNNISDYKVLRRMILNYIKLGVRYFCLDSINLMRWSEFNGNRNYEMEAILADIIGICTSKDYGYPHITVVAHLNRACEQRADKRPIMSDLKDTGGLEQWADLVMFLYRDGYYNPDTEFPNVAEILIEKNRNRLAPQVARAMWLPERFTFANLQQETVI